MAGRTAGGAAGAAGAASRRAGQARGAPPLQTRLLHEWTGQDPGTLAQPAAPPLASSPERPPGGQSTWWTVGVAPGM